MVGLSELPLELKGMIVEWAAQLDRSSYSRVPGDEKISYELFSNGFAPRGTSHLFIYFAEEDGTVRYE
jgi:hypothetical protein